GLERAGGATRQVSSLRLMANQVAIDLLQPEAGSSRELEQALRAQGQGLARLAGQNATQHTRIAAVPQIRQRVRTVVEVWLRQLKPAALRANETGDARAYLNAMRAFLAETDRLAGLIDLDIKKKRDLLRFLQGAIAVIGSVGTALTIYLLY